MQVILKNRASLSLKETIMEQGMRNKLFSTKKKAYFEKRLTEDMSKPKECWKNGKLLGLRLYL